MKHFFSVLLVALIVLPTQGQSAEELLQNALRLERSEGDFAGAIALYRQVAESTEFARPVTGRALMQMAMAYENMGRAEAARTYQRVLAEYGDLPELAAEAREGFARTAVEPASGPDPNLQVVLDVGADFESWGSAMSPSGRYLAGYNYDPAGIRVVDTESGAVLDYPLAAEGYGEHPRFSPDESRVAIGWRPGGRQTVADLLAVDRASGETSQVLDVADYYKKRDGLSVVSSTVQPLDWTSDGSHVVTFVGVSETGPPANETWTMEFLLVPMDGGAPKLLGGLDGAARYAWEKACLSSDDRFLFVDFYRQIEGRQNPYYIRRFELASGESRVWRDAPTGNTRLVGCAREPDRILYVDGAIGAPAVRYAEVTDEDGSDDPLLKRFSDDAYLALAAETGDVSAFLEPANRFRRGITLFEADPESGRLSGASRKIDTGFVRAVTWSPSGDRLAYFDTDRMDDRIAIIEIESGSETSYPIGPDLAGLSWDTPDEVGFWLEASDRGSNGTQAYDVGVLDLESGDTRTAFRASNLSELGFGLENYLGDESWLAWSQESQCLVRVAESTLDWSRIHCFEDSGRLRLSPSPTGEPLAVHRRVGDQGDYEVGLLSLQDQSYQSLLKDSSAGRATGVAWISDDKLVVLGGDDSWAFRRAEALNIATRERRELYPTLFEQYDASWVLVRPGGDTVAIVGAPKTLDEGTQPVTIVRNIAEVR